MTTVDPTAGNGEIELIWDVPDDGGSAITGYEVQVGGGLWTSIGSTNPTHVVDGLTNGTSYFFRVRAFNEYGKGEPSDAHMIAPDAGASLTTMTAPSQISTWTVTAVDSGALIVITAPPDGGSEILGYEAQIEGGAWLDRALGARFVVRGLSPGVEVFVKVRAFNRIGPGTASAAKTVTPSAAFTENPAGLKIAGPSTRPATISTLEAAIRSPGVRFTWNAPYNGGSAITDYEIQVGSGDWESVSDAANLRHDETASSGWIVARVRAVNAHGEAIESNLAGAKLPSGPEFP